MDRKKTVPLLAITLILIPLLLLTAIIAASLYIQFSSMPPAPPPGPPGAVCAASPVLLSAAIEPILLWGIVGGCTAIIVIFVTVLICVLAGRHRKKAQAAKTAAIEEDEQLAFELHSEDTAGADEAYAIAAAEADDASEAEEADDAPIEGQLTFETPVSNINYELLAKYIREVNEKADEYKALHAQTAAETAKRVRLKSKASALQNKLFKAHSLELITRCSTTLNKIYKLISKCEKNIAGGKREKNRLLLVLKEMRRTANNYIADNSVPLEKVTEIEDGVLYEIALSKKILESGLDDETRFKRAGLEKQCEELKEKISSLEAEYIYWEQSVETMTDGDERLEGALKLLDIQEVLDGAREELAVCLTEISGEDGSQALSHMTAAVKNSIISGSGLVTKEQKKIRMRSREWR